MKHLVLTLALLPTLVMAHNIKESTQVPLVNISDKGSWCSRRRRSAISPGRARS